MKKQLLLLLLLLAPSLQYAEQQNNEPKRKLAQETKVTAVTSLAIAALAGFALYEGYKFYRSDYFQNKWKLGNLGDQKIQEGIKYLTSLLIPGILGLQAAYPQTPDGRFDSAKKKIDSINRHLLELCKKATTDPITFYKEINTFFFYSQFPLVSAFGQFDLYDNSLIQATNQLEKASKNPQLADECYALLIEIKEMKRVFVEAMITLRKHPEWLEQMNSRNLYKAAKKTSKNDCARGFCA